MNNYTANRNFMKSKISDTDYKLNSDISHGVAQPPFQTPVPEDALIIDLPDINRLTAPKSDFFECSCSRISRRLYSDEPTSLFELSFLLWCTQGIKKIISGYRKYIELNIHQKSKLIETLCYE